jgi:hypothetical protein
MSEISNPAPARLEAIYTLIPKVSAAIGAVGKDRQNKDQNYKFRGIEDLMNACHAALCEHGVFCVPTIETHETSERATRSGGTQYRVLIRVRHRFFAPDGSFVDATTYGEALDSSDKATNKAMSFAFKYALNIVFAVPYADMAEGDAENPEAGPKVSSAPRTTAPLKLPAKPVTSPPPPAAEEPVEREPGSDDDADEFIDLAHQRGFYREFREACPQGTKNTDEIARQWLAQNGIVDETGKGTAKRIQLGQWDDVREGAQKYARSL